MAPKKEDASKTPPEPIPVSMGASAVGTTMTPHAAHFRFGYFEGPDHGHMEKYEVALRADPIMARAIQFITLTMLASVGGYIHSDQRAMKFYKEQNSLMTGNMIEELGQAIHSALWSGLGISEMILTPHKGKVYISRMSNYHPRSMAIVPNKHGLLTDGEKVSLANNRFDRSGIYQEIPWMAHTGKRKRQGRNYIDNHVRLPIEKIVHVGHNRRHGNWAGESLFAPVWIRYQQVIQTLMDLAITTERYGSPQVAVTVPAAPTTEAVDIGNGQVRYRTVAEKAFQALSQMNSSSALVFEEPVGLSAHERVRIQTLSSFNNFADSYLAIKNSLYGDILIGMGIPPLIILEHSGGLGAGAIAQVHAEAYKQFLIALYKEFVEPFVEQTMGRLLRWNFGITDPGKFEFNPFDIAAADTLMKVIDQATKLGYMHPDQPEDFNWVRAKFGMPQASEETMGARMKANAELMKFLRRPELEKSEIAKAQMKSSFEVATLTAETQKQVAEIQAKTQKDVAKLNQKAKAEQDAEKNALQRESLKSTERQAKMQHEQVMSGKAAQLAKANAGGEAAKAQAAQVKAKAAKAPKASAVKKAVKKKPAA